MKNTERVLLYQAIMQSNLHPTTKSFLGQVIKNMPAGMGDAMTLGALEEAAPAPRMRFGEAAENYGDLERDEVLSKMGLTEDDLGEDELVDYDEHRPTRGAVGSPERGIF